MNVADVREHWREVIDAVARRQERVVLEEAGIPVAALVSTGELERLRRYDAQRAADMAFVTHIGELFADIPDDELERDIFLAVEEARADLRAEREQAQRTA